MALASARDGNWVHPDWPLSRDHLWMTPLANVLLFALIGGVLLVLAKRWSRLASLRVSAFVFSCLCLYSWALIIPSFTGRCDAFSSRSHS